ncbi:uncharacterized protein LOC126045092 [Accipiter gentilis]|uniref:uncharacterized protein LOC126045092 n=1 Tax=Astur gentilis TaxID=8957 RepID=UPI0021108988|nr:uncharacterized protein LOC126045092 [Accipiter gentilis]
MGRVAVIPSFLKLPKFEQFSFSLETSPALLQHFRTPWLLPRFSPRLRVAGRGGWGGQACPLVGTYTFHLFPRPFPSQRYFFFFYLLSQRRVKKKKKKKLCQRVTLPFCPQFSEQQQGNCLPTLRSVRVPPGRLIHRSQFGSILCRAVPAENSSPEDEQASSSVARAARWDGEQSLSRRGKPGLGGRFPTGITLTAWGIRSRQYLSPAAERQGGRRSPKGSHSPVTPPKKKKSSWGRQPLSRSVTTREIIRAEISRKQGAGGKRKKRKGEKKKKKTRTSPGPTAVLLRGAGIAPVSVTGVSVTVTHASSPPPPLRLLAPRSAAPPAPGLANRDFPV